MLTTNPTKLVLQFQEVASTNYDRHADMNEHCYFFLFFSLLCHSDNNYHLNDDLFNKIYLVLRSSWLMWGLFQKINQNFLHFCHFCTWEHSNTALWGKRFQNKLECMLKLITFHCAIFIPSSTRNNKEIVLFQFL